MLLQHVPIPPSQVNAIDTTLYGDPEAMANTYERQLVNVLGKDDMQLDVILLGAMHHAVPSSADTTRRHGTGRPHVLALSKSQTFGVAKSQSMDRQRARFAKAAVSAHHNDASVAQSGPQRRVCSHGRIQENRGNASTERGPIARGSR
jgi:hypothetical protein